MGTGLRFYAPRGDAFVVSSVVTIEGNTVELLRKSAFAAIVFSTTALVSNVAFAETIFGALSKAYQFNSSVNSARAAARVTDENVPIAKSALRPTIAGVGNIDYTTRSGGTRTSIATGSFGIALQQTLFDGFQTRNNVAAADAQVKASFENVRNTEQNTLFDAAGAYMDVIRDRRVAVLTEQNLEFLNEQARAARSRLEVGEGTRTDVAQADASRASAVAQLSAARAQVATSSAVYRQVIGEDPGTLRAASPLSKLVPKSLGAAQAIAEAQHPAILASLHLVNAADFQVKSAEGALLPQLTGSARVERSFTETWPASPGAEGTSTSASIGATLNIPIYSGGRTSAVIRQSKETLGQTRIDVDVRRDQVRQAISSAWSAYVAARENVSANRQVVEAAQLALAGVIEERNVGQRTTLDVLNAQADVITAQINLANSERDYVVGSYAILSAMGALNVGRLGLKVAEYKPQEHYKAVKDKWFGLRTPDGR
ncbi:TolC family outer membrane protein [Pseudaminobacter sp. 19-2017]|uniref:TolC family outer membrane protein n=1 Tax=Pseudaminobacter soli (ex Zhang et al. 2022) TaxID=2831468 RepID=A0A942E322_9HYPH|nr:TolC family outer membrane protein [Pseudaminobacter soli]MBS3647607.1 TolC family outer membrane protein [Pseudaminobacter soli]